MAGSKVHWVIQEINYANDHNVAQRLMYLLTERGNPVTMFRHGPWAGTDWSFLPQEGPAVCYGTYNAVVDMKAGAGDLPYPSVWYDAHSFRCSTYYAAYGDMILQRGWRLVSLRQFLDQPDSFFGAGDVVFVRPDDNDKVFDGGLVKRGNLAGWSNMVGLNRIPDDTAVVVSSPRRIDAEWRFVLVGGEVAGGSQYKTNCCIDIAASYSSAAAEFAEAVAARYSPYAVFVVDVGLADGEYKVVEIGPFNYAGLYKVDLLAVVTKIDRLLANSCDDAET